MKNINIILFLIIFSFSFSQFIYEFNRDLILNENMTDKEIMTTIAYNDLFTYIKIGTPEKELKVSITFHEKSLVLVGSEVERPNVFNESESTSFKKVSNEMYLIKNQLYNGYICEDLLKLNNYDKAVKVQFFLAEEIYKSSYSFDDEYEPVSFSGYIGLSINSMFRTDMPESLPTYLYEAYNYDYNFKSPFTIMFDNPSDKKSYRGKLILNGYPHEYNKTYHEEQYLSSKMQKDHQNYPEWCFSLDTIYYDKNIVIENQRIIFRPEYGVIIGNDKLFKYLKDIYFNEYIENKICNTSKFDLIGDSYNYFVCDNKINITKMKNISFEVKENNFNFTLDYNDLFYEYNNKFYYLIISKNFEYSSFLYIGSPLMKKYEFVFDRYKSKIGYYNKSIPFINKEEENNNKGNNLVLIISIVALSVLIVAVLAYIIWSYLNKPRIQRKNELNDDYNYVSQETINN